MGNSMRNDRFYAEMLEMMREQGSKNNPATIQLGVMQSPTSVKIDDLVLYAEDLYIAEHLLAGYTRAIKPSYVSSVYLVGDNVNASLQSHLTFSEGLQKGDLVAVQKLANNKYLVLERVVSV